MSKLFYLTAGVQGSLVDEQKFIRECEKTSNLTELENVNIRKLGPKLQEAYNKAALRILKQMEPVAEKEANTVRDVIKSSTSEEILIEGFRVLVYQLHIVFQLQDLLKSGTIDKVIEMYEVEWNNDDKEGIEKTIRLGSLAECISVIMKVESIRKDQFERLENIILSESDLEFLEYTRFEEISSQKIKERAVDFAYNKLISNQQIATEVEYGMFVQLAERLPRSWHVETLNIKEVATLRLIEKTISNWEKWHNTLSDPYGAFPYLLSAECTDRAIKDKLLGAATKAILRIKDLEEEDKEAQVQSLVYAIRSSNFPRIEGSEAVSKFVKVCIRVITENGKIEEIIEKDHLKYYNGALEKLHINLTSCGGDNIQKQQEILASIVSSLPQWILRQKYSPSGLECTTYLVGSERVPQAVKEKIQAAAIEVIKSTDQLQNLKSLAVRLSTLRDIMIKEATTLIYQKESDQKYYENKPRAKILKAALQVLDQYGEAKQILDDMKERTETIVEGHIIKIPTKIIAELEAMAASDKLPIPKQFTRSKGSRQQVVRV